MNQDLEQQVLYGNLSVQSNGDTLNNGDGSIEAQGTLYTDRIKPYTTNGTTSVHDTKFKDTTVTFKAGTVPPNPPSGEVAVYVDPTLNRLRQKNSTGTTTALVSAKGDLLTFNGSAEQILPVTPTDGYVLTSDSSTSTGLVWQQPRLAYYAFNSSTPESNTSSLSFQTKVTLNFNLTEAGNYRISCSFAWRTSALSSAFLGRMLLDDNIVLFTNRQAPSGVGLLGLGASSNTTSYFVVRNLATGPHNVKIQWAADSILQTAFISNTYVDVFKI